MVDISSLVAGGGPDSSMISISSSSSLLSSSSHSRHVPAPSQVQPRIFLQKLQEPQPEHWQAATVFFTPTPPDSSSLLS